MPKNLHEVYTNRTLPAHDRTAPGEAMLAVRFPDVPKTILSYLGGDVAETKALSSAMRNQFRLFGATIEDVLLPVATQAATLILGGEAKEVEEAIALVKKHPDILRCRVTARDHLERAVEGTLLQIAAMAGDVNLQNSEDIKEEDCGVVERLASIPGGLLPEEVKTQLDEVITGTTAKSNNDTRNNRILDAITAFGNGILRKASEYKKDKEDGNNFQDFQQFCQPCIDDLEKALRSNPNEVIKSGYIFDLTILQKSAAWFNENVDRFGDWDNMVSEVFWINGFGKLQLKLSARDGHVMRRGIGYIAEDEKEIPRRTLNNDDGTSFLNSSSGCGHNFKLGYYGMPGGMSMRDRSIPIIKGPVGPWTWASTLQKICQSKAAALQKLCSILSSKTECELRNLTHR